MTRSGPAIVTNDLRLYNSYFDHFLSKHVFGLITLQYIAKWRQQEHDIDLNI